MHLFEILCRKVFITFNFNQFKASLLNKGSIKKNNNNWMIVRIKLEETLNMATVGMQVSAFPLKEKIIFW